MKISLALSAYADLETIEVYYQDQHVPHIGTEFINQIFNKIDNLIAHPKMGRKVPEFDKDHIRELIFPPFRIVYKIDDELIRIVRIWRSERLLKLHNVIPHSINEPSSVYKK